jgi:hypothetical protein
MKFWLAQAKRSAVCGFMIEFDKNRFTVVKDTDKKESQSKPGANCIWLDIW